MSLKEQLERIENDLLARIKDVTDILDAQNRIMTEVMALRRQFHRFQEVEDREIEASDWWKHGDDEDKNTDSVE